MSSSKDAETSFDGRVLDRLYAVIESRRGAHKKSSNTAKLFHKGTGKIAQKLGEEAVETVIEAVSGDKSAVIAESADLLYHLLVLWAAREIAVLILPESVGDPSGRAGGKTLNSQRQQAADEQKADEHGGVLKGDAAFYRQVPDSWSRCRGGGKQPDAAASIQGMPAKIRVGADRLKLFEQCF